MRPPVNYCKKCLFSIYSLCIDLQTDIENKNITKIFLSYQNRLIHRLETLLFFSYLGLPYFIQIIQSSVDITFEQIF